MDRFDFAAHSSSQYNEEMKAIHSQLMQMGALVRRQLADAVQAVLTGDASLVAAVLAREEDVDALEKRIDEGCAHVLALRQPAATDLRLLIAVSKCVSDFERIGDEAVKVAKAAAQLAEAEQPVDVDGIADIGTHVGRMLEDALTSFTDFDARKAVDVAVDMRYRDALRTLAGRKIASPDAIPQLLNLTWVLRSLERVGDHAHNISEQVIYLVIGRDVRHLSVEQITNAIGGG